MDCGQTALGADDVQSGRSLGIAASCFINAILPGDIEVDGQNYEWELQREPQWCTADGWRGMTVAIRLAGAQREAILEFPDAYAHD